jgi:hypothetical protein
MKPNLPKQSIIPGAVDRAHKHKWYESEKANHDVGHNAIIQWRDAFWLKYVKGCFYEHLAGEYLYEEFNEKSYNILQVFTFRTPSLRSRIQAQLRDGRENLEIINWAMDNGYDMEEVIGFMERADVNFCRLLPCPLGENFNG